MDASYIFAFFGFALVGWLAGRATRQFHWDMECYDRSFAADSNTFTDSDAGTDSHAVSVNDGPGWYFNKRRDARRRTVLRNHSGTSPDRHAFGSAPYLADEEALNARD